MQKVCVVTGGGSGMGLSAAKLMGRDHHIILVGRTVSKLENALAEVRDTGAEAEIFPCDISDRSSVQKLAAHAGSRGQVRAVIHAAGLSPNMADGETIFKVNALGTIYMNEEFTRIMPANSCILNVSSMSAYMLPEDRIPKQLYAQSLSDPEGFYGAMCGMLRGVPGETAPGMAYTISKNFVIWYSEKLACVHGKAGIRILSISPGTFRTPMGELEGEQAANFAIQGALGRMGEPEEIAVLMAFVAGESCSYLTGVDILCDGGSVAAMRRKSELGE